MTRCYATLINKLVSRKLIFFSLIHMGIIQALSGFTSYFLSMHNNGIAARDLFFTRDYFKDGAPDFISNGKVFLS
jgi:hypothetical protein